MKKMMSFVLAVVLVLSMSMTAFAATADENNPTASINVTGKYTEGSTAAEKLSVDVVWGAMEFTYNDAVQGEWDPESHGYHGAVTAYWSAAGNTITVTNHSNAGVTASVEFEAAAGVDVTGSFTETSGTANDNKLELATAVGTAVADAPKAEVTFNITDGAIAADTTALGTIIVTIAKQ